MKLPAGKVATSLAALVVSVLALAGCGPVKSTSLIMDADVLVEAARTADAEKLAPYEYTAAVTYLHKAREEQGYSDFEIAIDYAKKAGRFAAAAKEKASAITSEGALPSEPVDPPPLPKPASPGAEGTQKVAPAGAAR